MDRLFFVGYYTSWHYSKGMRELFRNWMDFLWFLTEFFSLGVLVKTLFSPWERMNEGYRQGFHPSEIAETFLLNSIMRIVGFFVRILVLFFGFLSLVVSLIIGMLCMVCWFLFPLILFFLLALSIQYFFV